MAVRWELRVVEVVGAVRPVPQGVALPLGVKAKAERRDADEAVKEAIDDHAEPTGCCLGPAVRRHGSPPRARDSLRHVLPESPRTRMTATHSLIIDSSATAFSLTLTFSSLTVFVVGPVSLGPRRQVSGASKAERRDADEAVEEAIDDHAEPTGCCLGPAVRRHGSPPRARDSLRHVLPESPRTRMTATHSLIIDSFATALSLSLLSLTVFVVGPVPLGPRRQASDASTRAHLNC